MTNYRGFKAVSLAAGQSGSCNLENGTHKNVWGVMRGTSATSGSVALEGSGSILLEHLAVGEPFPCYPVNVTCTAGTVYILS
jgi:hypothetical protein